MALSIGVSLLVRTVKMSGQMTSDKFFDVGLPTMFLLPEEDGVDKNPSYPPSAFIVLTTVSPAG